MNPVNPKSVNCDKSCMILTSLAKPETSFQKLEKLILKKLKIFNGKF